MFPTAGSTFGNKGENKSKASAADGAKKCQWQLPDHGKPAHFMLILGLLAAKLLAVLSGCQALVKRQPLLLGRVASHFVTEAPASLLDEQTR